ncbi:MAG: thiamine pyrophosphate-dependent dehydrogenase E1 component subunit alpha [Rhizobiaceae bacterium]|nr:thiamine pyrophosphate-dependent dehydrogenase E1 component subunit alpha [Rhizobiaceae bacterium]
MVTIRQFEERLSAESKSGILPGPVHVYIGQEAVAVGICAQLTDDDWITSTHRGHGHFLAKGGTPAALMKEIYGRETGICGGKGGSMHVADFSRGIIGANGIVGGGIALATGAALAAQLDGKGRCAIAFFGDGAANQGVMCEAMNVAALWKLPLILVCENNGYSEFSKAADVTAGVLSDRAKAYGVPSEQVDGNDFMEVWRAAGRAVARARNGEGPTFLEARTYRLHGHVESEHTFLPKAYREESEVEAWRERDPIKAFAAMLSDGIASAQELEAIEQEIAALVEEAAAEAAADPWPDPEAAFKHMFA